MTPECSVVENDSPCGLLATSRGMCQKHYRRWYRHGSPLVVRGTPSGAAIAHFETHVMEPSDGCRIWPYAHNGVGYGVARLDGRQTLVTRSACERWHGPPPTPTHQAGHSCGQGHAGCWAGEHLRWVTPAENQADRIAHGTSNLRIHGRRWK